MTASLWLANIVGLGVSVVAMIALRPVAVAINLVDKPGGRKTHHGNVPIVGGLAMLLGLVVAAATLPPTVTPPPMFVAASVLLVILGLLDDRFQLSAVARLVAHAAIVGAVAVATGALVRSIGSPFAAGQVEFSGIWAYVVTLIFVAGAVNAFNMLDGMDGLAGAMAIVAMITFGWIGYFDDHLTVVAISFLMSGAVVGFLMFNVPMQLNRHVRCFMGDSGSTLLGFVLAYQSIIISQGPSATTSPVIILWLAAMPIYELLWTIVRRVSRGRSPLTADREHMHHLLLDGGFGVRAAFVVLILFGIVLASIGLILHFLGAPDWFTFGAFLVCGVGTVRFMYRAPSLLWRLPESMRRVATAKFEETSAAAGR